MSLLEFERRVMYGILRYMIYIKRMFALFGKPYKEIALRNSLKLKNEASCSAKIQEHVDVCIVGGGMVGAAVALGLAQQNLRVVLVEKSRPEPFSVEQVPDIRMSALNMHSIDLLKRLGAWQHVLNMRCAAYDTLSVWEDENTPTKFTAQEVKQDVLGYFVENRVLQLALYQQIETIAPDRVSFVFDQGVQQIDSVNAQISLDDGQIIKSRIIIGADGTNSQVRQSCGIATTGWEYGQQANAILVKMHEPIPRETWQAFTAKGPRALLPMHDQHACLVWYDDAAQSEWIKHAEHADLTAAIKLNFPRRLGDFDILQAVGFGLTRMHATRYGHKRVIILGDAAHAINPLAGQGVNLGFKDVNALLACLAENSLDDVPYLTKMFEKARKADNLLMMSTMDALYLAFSTPLSPIKQLRMLGLHLANRAGPVKRRALRYAMGLD